MKKKLSILAATVAAFVIAFALSGCSGEPSIKIDLGGNLGNFESSGVCYGSNYKVVDTPQAVTYEDVQSTTYYCEKCDTPYIIVYRWDATGQTFEQSLKESATLEGVTHTDVIKTSISDQTGKFSCGKVLDGVYYYIDTLHFRDGNDAVELCFLAATEEVKLGDTGLYAYIPTGYSDKTKDAGTGFIVFGEYEDCYYNPDFSIESYQTPQTYECLVANNAYWYKNNTFPITEEDWKKYQGDVTGISWTTADEIEYYGKLGYELLYDGEWAPVCGAKVCFDVLKKSSENGNEICDVIYLSKGTEMIEIWFSDDADHFSRYADSFINSIHTK